MWEIVIIKPLCAGCGERIDSDAESSDESLCSMCDRIDNSRSLMPPDHERGDN